MNDKRKAYEEKLDAQLKEWSAQIALLKAKADNAKADAKIEYYKTIDALQRKQNEAETKLQELKTAGDEAWEDLKAEAEKAWRKSSRLHESTRLKYGASALPCCFHRVRPSMINFEECEHPHQTPGMGAIPLQRACLSVWAPHAEKVTCPALSITGTNSPPGQRAERLLVDRCAGRKTGD